VLAKAIGRDHAKSEQNYRKEGAKKQKRTRSTFTLIETFTFPRGLPQGDHSFISPLLCLNDLRVENPLRVLMSLMLRIQLHLLTSQLHLQLAQFKGQLLLSLTRAKKARVIPRERLLPHKKEGNKKRE
jgi:hypothetical protein